MLTKDSGGKSMKKSLKLMSAILAASTVASTSPIAFAGSRCKKSSGCEKIVVYGLLGAGVSAIAAGVGISLYRAFLAENETDNTSKKVWVINSQKDFEKIAMHKNEIEKIIINVENIPDFIFQDCPKLVEASLPKVKSIGPYLFFQCKKLKKVIAPKLKTISAGAFMNCESLEEFDLENVSEIGNNAFKGCPNFSFMDLVNAENKNR